MGIIHRGGRGEVREQRGHIGKFARMNPSSLVIFLFFLYGWKLVAEARFVRIFARGIPFRWSIFVFFREGDLTAKTPRRQARPGDMESILAPVLPWRFGVLAVNPSCAKVIGGILSGALGGVGD
jgi:hypothetical protein